MMTNEKCREALLALTREVAQSGTYLIRTEAFERACKALGIEFDIRTAELKELD
jgi:hypothetical protein